MPSSIASGSPMMVMERACMCAPPCSGQHPGGATGRVPHCSPPTSCAMPLPGVCQQRASALQQLGQGLGLADDRHEVLVAQPARDDVLVQVGGDAGASDGSLVHA